MIRYLKLSWSLGSVVVLAATAAAVAGTLWRARRRRTEALRGARLLADQAFQAKAEFLASQPLEPPPPGSAAGGRPGLRTGPVRAAAARILVADDNGINQEIVEALLREAGFRVDLADDGAQAVRRVQANRYDLVLMDIQMPVMDGLTATAEIRRLPGLAGLPILAMTAGGLDSDRALCLAAGINGHILKPFDSGALWKELFRWVRPAPGVSPSGPAPAGPDGSLPGDIPGLDPASGLRRLLGRKDLYLARLRAFSAGQEAVPAQVRAALKQGDFRTAERLARGLQDRLEEIGAGPLGRWAADLEAAIRQRRAPETLDALADGLEIRMADLIVRLNRSLRRAG